MRERVEDRVGPGDVGAGAAAAGERLGDVDLHAHERAAEGLAEAVGAQRTRAAAAQRVAQNEVEREHVARLVALDGAAHHRAEVLLDALGADLARDDVVGLVVVGEDRHVGDAALVAGPVAAELAQLQPRHQPTSSIVTRTFSSTSFRSTSVGQMPTSSVGRPPPCRPIPVKPAGGADRVSGMSSRPTTAAVRSSAQRQAARTTHSGGSTGAGAVGPPSAFAPQNSKHHSSTARPAISTRFASSAAVAFAFSYASGHENAARASPDQPAWYASSAL